MILIVSVVTRFGKPINLPNIVDLMMRTTLLASVQKTESVKKLVDLYIQPPVGRFGLMQFDSFDDIAAAGYQHAQAALRDWKRERPELERMLQPAAAPIS